MPTAGNDIAPTPGRTTSSRCVATPAPPAVCRDVYGTLGTVIARTPPVKAVPTTWIVAVPLKLAIPPDRVTGLETVPFTCICATLAHGPNGNPPERPAITQRNSPPDDDAVNPSCEVVPSGPSTIPPPLTLGPDAYATDCDARSKVTAKAATMTARVPICFMNTPLIQSRLPARGYSTPRKGARPSDRASLTKSPPLAGAGGSG